VAHACITAALHLLPERTRRHAGYAGKYPAEVRRVVEAQRVGDAGYGQIGVDEIAPRFAHDALVN